MKKQGNHDDHIRTDDDLFQRVERFEKEKEAYELEEARRRQAEIDEKRRQAQQESKRRLQAEIEDKRRQAELEERQRRTSMDEARRLQTEEETKNRLAEETRYIKSEERKRALQALAEERARKEQYTFSEQTIKGQPARHNAKRHSSGDRRYHKEEKIQHNNNRASRKRKEDDVVPVASRQSYYQENIDYGEDEDILQKIRPLETDNKKNIRFSSRKRLFAPFHPALKMVLRDFICFAVALCAFFYFYHKSSKNAQEIRPTPTLEPTSAVALTPSASQVQLTPSLSPGPTQTIAPQTIREKFTGKFTSGEAVKTESTYKSANISIELNKKVSNGTTYFVADIYVADISYFRTALARGKYGRGVNDSTLDIANENSAVLAISGDYYGSRSQGIVLRNSMLYRETPYEDVLVMYYDGSMKTFDKTFDLNTLRTTGAYQIWSYGPMLLNNGKAMTTFNSTAADAKPRSAIGYYEPGHYCFVTVDGSQKNYSVGLTLPELSKVFEDLGCKTAYNLYGVQTAVMAFQGKVINQPNSGGRSVSDIIYIGE